MVLPGRKFLYRKRFRKFWLSMMHLYGMMRFGTLWLLRKKDIAAGRIVVLGGDFNEPSHLDWIRETKDLYDHHGLIIPWTVPLILDNNGFIDTYREIYPDVLAYPGFTFPADNPLIPVNKLTWAPKADERDRIDYIFYYPAEGLSVKDAVIFGPEGSICKSQRIKETSKDRFITPLAVWPTDHKGLLVTFGLTANSGR